MNDITAILEQAAATPTSPPDLTQAHRRAHQMRRRRHATIAFAAIAATLCVVGSIVAISEGGDARHPRIASPPNGNTTYTNSARSITLDYPAHWQIAHELLTPHLGLPGEPYEVVALGTFPMAPADHNCAHVPVNALETMSRTDAFVWIGERPDYAAGTFPPRPANFTPDLGTDVTTGTDYSAQPDGCLDHPLAGTARVISFEDHGRSFYALVAIGTDATPGRAAEAYEILNSFSITG
jgi:hypothetical protein